MERLLSPSGGLVIGVDASKTVVYWPRAAELSLGIPAEKAIGRLCRQAFGCSGCEESCAFEAGISRDVVEVTVGDGLIRRFERTLVPHFDEHGRFGGGVEVLVPRERRQNRGWIPLLRDPSFRSELDQALHLASAGHTIYLEGEPGTAFHWVAEFLGSCLEAQGEPEFIAGGHDDLLNRLRHFEPEDVLLVGDLDLLDAVELRQLAHAIRRSHRARMDGIAAGSIWLCGPPIDELPPLPAALASVLEHGRVEIPPLRAREDFEAHVWWVLQGATQMTGLRDIDPEVIETLRLHRWPGNDDELTAVLLQAARRDGTELLQVEHLPPSLRSLNSQAGSKVAEARRILEVLAACDGNKSHAAKELGVSRSTLWRKLRQYGIDAD